MEDQQQINKDILNSLQAAAENLAVVNGKVTALALVVRLLVEQNENNPTFVAMLKAMIDMPLVDDSEEAKHMGEIVKAQLRDLAPSSITGTK
ncbi:hypothetical protein ACN22W_20090 [Burkholderia theae]|uniref:hypothetical protein n=1 Tax=Burkholderia theae TaxID=3143496 RepID=UPI003AFAEB81